jgi:hypothetical protein
MASDEIVVRIAGERMRPGVPSTTKARFSTYWCSAAATPERALRLMRKLLRKQGFAPKLLVTDKLRS